MFLTRLAIAISSNHAVDSKTESSVNNQAEEKIITGIDEDLKYRELILTKLRNREVLLVLDNAEDPLEFDNAGFVNELNAILDHCRNVKFLVTTRKTIDKPAHNVEKTYTLHPLTKEASLKLLISKAPRVIQNEEIVELLK